MSPSDRWRGMQGLHFLAQSHPFSNSFSHLPGSSPPDDFYCNFPLYSWAKQAKSCESNSQAMSLSISFPSCLWEPTPWVNYPLWKSHLSSNPWAQSPLRLVPSPFWTLLLLIGCDIHLLCMPQNIVSCSSLSGLPYLFPFLLFLRLGESLWTTDPKRNLKMSAERKRQTHEKKDWRTHL